MYGYCFEKKNAGMYGLIKHRTAIGFSVICPDRMVNETMYGPFFLPAHQYDHDLR